MMDISIKNFFAISYSSPGTLFKHLSIYPSIPILYQVHYKRNMPDIDSLLDVWPEEFEQALKTLKLPSPDLDLTLLEYSKTLCAILDIPTYENPVESLHQMFSLYMDFRNNPHLQARDFTLTDRDRGGNNGAADIMNVDPAYK